MQSASGLPQKATLVECAQRVQIRDHSQQPRRVPTLHLGSWLEVDLCPALTCLAPARESDRDSSRGCRTPLRLIGDPQNSGLKYQLDIFKDRAQVFWRIYPLPRFV